MNTTRRLTRGVFLLTAVLLVAYVGWSAEPAGDAAPPPVAGVEGPVEPEVAPAECLIKGNISRNTGEWIYHVPGQEHYDETVVDEAAGERWFCSEAEAQAAGWRKSTV